VHYAIGRLGRFSTNFRSVFSRTITYLNFAVIEKLYRLKYGRPSTFRKVQVFKLSNLSFRYLHRVSHFISFCLYLEERKITAGVFSDLYIFSSSFGLWYPPGITGQKGWQAFGATKHAPCCSIRVSIKIWRKPVCKGAKRGKEIWCRVKHQGGGIVRKQNALSTFFLQNFPPWILNWTGVSWEKIKFCQAFLLGVRCFL
jgi:hypothetical protein